MRIEIEEPRQSWVEDFASLKSAIMGAAPAGAYLHHFGSTAVPGLPAKNIIDIQLTVHDLADVDADAFEEAGFERRPIVIDHCPPGVDLAEGELRKAFYRSNGRPANLHMRAHPTAGNAYALIKQRLAQRFPDDVDFYYDIKDPVFDIIMDGANDWAKLIGWSEPPGD
ncbi:GrpB family protein [Rhizobium leguminosarum]|uniref:GrpB family protein n=1 Tax=Rhizobium TaxID=379 RepID=UPI00138A5D51|nr:MULTISPECIES: GrpB family protein [Rhizobium]MBY5355324.1 GrpB family protein [Rhizobium leguminosarum]MBY5365833.1 GrpB family protein [Rhizobium leguminosarum]MBY5449080.1 GrpB family protein [Rhizobium leguminosarum]NDK52866.1 GrpB family protein [Rhizobium laguerreae]NNH45338.1 GrpB family protein [Rhizobium laguerreae]